MILNVVCAFHVILAQCIFYVNDVCSVRRAKVRKIITLEAWEQGMKNFGQHMLKPAPSSFLQDAILEAERIAASKPR